MWTGVMCPQDILPNTDTTVMTWIIRNNVWACIMYYRDLQSITVIHDNDDLVLPLVVSSIRQRSINWLVCKYCASKLLCTILTLLHTFFYLDLCVPQEWVVTPILLTTVTPLLLMLALLVPQWHCHRRWQWRRPLSQLPGPSLPHH